MAGTANGMTAIQLDVKLKNGVPLNILEKALDAAKEGRLQILQEMARVQPGPRRALKESAPSADMIRYDPSRKVYLIGPGGDTVKYIEKTYDCQVDTNEEGVVYLFSKSRPKLYAARDLIQDLVVIMKEGDILTGEVLEVKDYGAFMKVTRAQQALLHVSEITNDPILMKKPMDELLSVGQKLKVKVMSFMHLQ